MYFKLSVPIPCMLGIVLYIRFFQGGDTQKKKLPMNSMYTAYTYPVIISNV